MTAKIQVIFYSMYGHTYQMAEAVAAGAREKFAHIPVAKPEQLAEADATLFGAPARFGNMCAQTRNFLDQTGPSGPKAP